MLSLFMLFESIILILVLRRLLKRKIEVTSSGLDDWMSVSPDNSVSVVYGSHRMDHHRKHPSRCSPQLLISISSRDLNQ